MAEVGSATVAIVPTFTGFRSKLSGEAEGAGKESGSRFAGAFKGLVGPAIALAGAGIFSGFIGEAARASDATDKFKATMGFAGLDTSAIDAATKATKEYADQTVYDLPTIQNTLAQLASNGVKDYTGLTKAAGNLNAVAGGNAETFKSVAMTMTQTAGAGKLTTENWNQLSDAIPGAAGPLMKALEGAGAYTGNFRDAMADGQITADEFNAALMQLGTDPIAVEAAKSTKTFEGALGSLSATITGGLTSALNTMKPAITGAINGVTAGIGAVVSTIGEVWAGLTMPPSAVASIGAPLEGFVAVGAKIRGVFDGIAPTLGAVFGTIGATIGPLIPQFVALYSSISPVSLIFRAIQPLLPQLVAVFSQLAGVIGGALSGVLTGIVPMFVQLSAVLVQTFSGVLAAVLPAVVQLVTMLGTTLATLIPILLPIIATVMQLATSLIGSLAPILTQLVTAILPVVVSAFGLVMTVIPPLVELIAGVLIPIIEALMPVVVTVFGVVVDIITSAMQIVQGVIQVVTGITSGNWSQVWEGIQNIFGGIWNTIVSVLKGAVAIVQSVIGAALNIISSTWNNIWSGVSTFFASIWDGIVSGARTQIAMVVTVISGVKDSILGFFAGAGSWLLDVGRNIIQGLMLGITNMAGSVVSAVQDVVGGAIDGAKSLLGIKSPSRVFRQIGVYTGEGMVQGLDAMQGKVKAATHAMVSIPAAQPMSYAGAATAAAVGAAAGAAVVIHGDVYAGTPQQFVAEINSSKRRAQSVNNLRKVLV